MSVGSNIGVAPPGPSDSLVVAAAAGQIIASLGLVAAAAVAALPLFQTMSWIHKLDP
ncbi:hypothetical protein H634G_11471 [Metarhizium anisopliae BRIP 53293]|uniref:Uncharacterized protein n=1 Tax=Metarhizium anisopliae BRIP 53293 TaxID=1291518 RepID=A0A0D9NHE8_METAN|nr:hypothetical protein H634G_11471 [Metarhizium anisopliae BRIP 53293]